LCAPLVLRPQSLKIAVVQLQLLRISCLSCIAVRLVLRIEYCSSVVRRQEVKLIVVLARPNKGSAEVNRKVVFRSVLVDVVLNVVICLEL
jgi:hypothetical protein